MAAPASRQRLSWQLAHVVELVHETAHTTTIVLAAPSWEGHHAGQHVDVRLSAADGYRPQRSYSLASAPEDQHLTLTVESIEDGSVSPYLAQTLRVGDELELRGPLGDAFVWRCTQPEPLQLIAGGSGIVPLRAMLRHRVANATSTPARLLYSARSMADLIYAAEIPGWRQTGAEVVVTLTRRRPTGWGGYRRRVDRQMIDVAAIAPDHQPQIYVCGPTAFVETVGVLLVEAGHAAANIRIEEFCPTG
jgi:ferredoxin-NADP reductase